jgi:hypothetical protein
MVRLTFHKKVLYNPEKFENCIRPFYKIFLILQKKEEMSGLLPVTSNIFFDNFCANFFGSGLSTSNPVRNPILSLPNNVTVSLIGGYPNGNPLMDSNPQRIRLTISPSPYTNNFHNFLTYTFDYPIDLSVILDNLSPSRFFSIFAIYNIFPGPGVSMTISVGIRFFDVFSKELTVTSTPKGFNTVGVLFEDLVNVSMQTGFDPTKVKRALVFIDINIIPGLLPLFLDFYSLGLRRYPVVGESITGTPTCFLYDNFMNSQKISGSVPQNNQLTLPNGDFFDYTTSGQIIRTLESSGSAPTNSCTINIFENFTNPSSNSPATAYISLNASASTSVKGIIKYGSNSLPIQITSQCIGVIAYRIISTIPTNATLTVEVLDETNSLQSRQYINATLNNVHGIEYLTFDVPVGNNKNLSFEFTNTNSNTSSSATIEVHVLYIMLWKSPTPGPTLLNFFLDKTYHNLLTGSQPNTDPHGLFPKNATKSHSNTTEYTITEDQYSTLITFLTDAPIPSQGFIIYTFSPPANFTAIQNFIILATSSATNANFTFSITIFSGTQSIDYTSNNPVTLNNHNSQMSVVRLDNLQTNSDPYTILSNASLMILSLSVGGHSAGSTLRIHAIVCEYDCNIFPLYDNFILNQLQNNPLIVTPTDRSFNFPGHPIRELRTPSSSNSNINVDSSIIVSFNSPVSGFPIAKCFRISLNNFQEVQSGICTFPLRYRNINLNKNLTYFLTLTYFFPDGIGPGVTINSFTLNIKNAKTGATIQTEILGANLNNNSPVKQDINFIIDLLFEEDIEFEFVVDVSNLGITTSPDIFIDIPYIIIQAETSTCVLEGTRITMADRTLKKIEDIKRGDLVLTVNGPLPVCRVIKENLSGLISLCKVPKGSISENIPYNDLYVCSRHVIRYNGKRRLATTLKAFKGVEILSGKRNQITNKLYMYDLQFEIETFYYAEGLESQSRSPYCHLSPLPKQLYFKKHLYKDIKVPDSLMYETEGFDNNWPNVYNRFSWRTYLAKYILNHPEIEFKPEDFNEKKALELKDKEHIDLTEIIPDDFDWEEYVRAHKDLKHLKNEMEACVHWVKYGYRENRYYKKYPFV